MTITQEPQKLKNHCFYNTKDLEQKQFQKTEWFCYENHSGTPEAQKTIVFTTQKTWGKNISGKLNGLVMKITQEPPKLKNHCFYNTK